MSTLQFHKGKYINQQRLPLHVCMFTPVQIVFTHQTVSNEARHVSFCVIKKRVWSHSFQLADFVIFFSSIKQTRSKSMCSKYMIYNIPFAFIIISIKERSGSCPYCIQMNTCIYKPSVFIFQNVIQTDPKDTEYQSLLPYNFDSARFAHIKSKGILNTHSFVFHLIRFFFYFLDLSRELDNYPHTIHGM